MSFINFIKAKPKQSPDSENQVDKRIIQAILSNDDLSKEYLDKADINSLIKAYKHIVYICVNRNSSVMSTTGFKLLSKKKPTGRAVKSVELTKFYKAQLRNRHEKLFANASELVEITEHPFLDLFKHVNPFTTYSNFIYQTNTYKDLAGNTFWYIEKNGVGTPTGLYILPTQDVKIKPSSKFFIEEYYMKNDDELIVFRPEEIIHHKTFDPANQFFGMSPLAASEAVYNMREYMDRYELNLYSHYGVPSAIITTDKEVIGTSGWEDARTLLRRELGGLNNAGKIGLLDRGFKYEKISSTPKELESLAGRKATASEIRNAFGQTDALYEASANRSTSDTADYSFRRDAILPRLTFIQDEINSKLLPMFDENLIFVFDNPVPVDVEKQSEQLTKYVGGTILTPNEARLSLGYEKHDGEYADELLIAVNLATMTQVANDKKNKEE
jgi:HK97 family phage portal protein